MKNRKSAILGILIIGIVLTIAVFVRQNLPYSNSMLVADVRAQGQEYSTGYAYVWKVTADADNGYLWINVSGNFSTAHNCSNLSFARSLLKLDDRSTQAQMQIALSSNLAHKEIWISTRGCTDDGYPIFYRLTIIN